jgi:hypothetical protein
MQGAVDADAAELHRFGGSGDIAFGHKHHKYRQLTEGNILANVVFHCAALPISAAAHYLSSEFKPV